MVKVKSNTFEIIYEIVRRIPAGKVVTYGQISKMLNKELGIMNYGKRITPRIVGYALHANSNPKISCHRVVNKDGKLAFNYAFGGWRKQKERLSKEGVTFRDEMHVDLKKHIAYLAFT